jgi:hypothetical protein
MNDPAISVSLTPAQIHLLRTSLEFTREKFAEYPYPNEALRRERIAEVTGILEAFREAKQAARAKRPSA